MSFKLNRFNNEIFPLWEEVKRIVDEIDESNVSDSYIENFAYLRKIINFLSEAMSSIDADLFPNEFIDDAESYLSNLKSNLINSQNYTNYYISYIEDNLDNLLKIVFPFVLHKGKAIKGLRFGLS